VLATAAVTTADQVKEACVRLMAAEIRAVKRDATKEHLSSLAAQQQHKQRGKMEQQQHQERLEQALAEYKQLKKGHKSGNPGTGVCVQGNAIH
jgi:hypothetical protein